MCRFTAYIGENILLADLITKPSRSVIRQSFNSRERQSGPNAACPEQAFQAPWLNGDGFGIGWYAPVLQAQMLGAGTRGADGLDASSGSAATATLTAVPSVDAGCNELRATAQASAASQRAGTGLLEDVSPCVFTSLTPAWNSQNLDRLAKKVVSPLFFAHVRAAGPGMAVNESCCHPMQVSEVSATAPDVHPVICFCFTDDTLGLTRIYH